MARELKDVVSAGPWREISELAVHAAGVTDRVIKERGGDLEKGSARQNIEYTGGWKWNLLRRSEERTDRIFKNLFIKCSEHISLISQY